MRVDAIRRSLRTKPPQGAETPARREHPNEAMHNGALLLSAASAAFMAGVIWVIQLVHYPLFSFADMARFAEFHAQHSARITLIVMPAMLLELGSSLALVAATEDPLERRAALLGVGLVGIAWATTAFASVPAHGRLSGGFDAAAHRALVTTNVLRTVAWTAHAALKFALLAQRLR